MSTQDDAMGSVGVDMDLYSRQLGTYGLETMSKLVAMRVLISGVQGAGLETAKNLILAGPACVTIHDDTIIDQADLGANFYLREEDVGKKSRSEGCLEKLKSLNPYVDVSVYTGALNQSIITQHDCVVVCNTTQRQLVEINALCRANKIGFIAIGVYGLCCSIFVDFGAEHIVTDIDGEEVKQVIIESIISDADKTIINCVDEKKIPFQVGDFVEFSEVEGCDELNNLPPQRIALVSKFSFQISLGSSKFGKYSKGGIAKQIKVPKKVSFRSYRDAIEMPIAPGEFSLITPDLAKFGRSEQLHIGLQALLEFESKNECVPEPRDPKACDEIFRIAENINNRFKEKGDVEGVIFVEQVDRKVTDVITSYSLCHISPIAAFVGGIVAQEIIKMTGKYMPIHQWLYFDALEMLENLDLDLKDCIPTSASRYDDQIILWGHTIQERLANLNVFVVGAGALGCEYLKGLAMMGVGTGPRGLITVTDMDRIEVSNLNRQFLFRREHVGKAKSATACDAILEMNPKVKVKAIETRVGVETENVLTDAFWDQQDVIINALDNISSRLYVDSKCVWHLKPLLESGTLGTKGNVQVVVPKLTESYGDARDPPEESIPLCTLRHFPNQIEHTIEWARDLFQGTFNDAVLEAQKILRDTEAAFKILSLQGSANKKREILERIEALLNCVTSPSSSFPECVKLAVELFHKLFYIEIAQLLHNFPVDHVTENGALFWSGPKRPPRIIKFDVSDDLHLAFVTSAANLFAFAVGIQQERDLNVVRSIAAQVQLQPFKPKQIVIKTSDTDQVVEGAVDDVEACKRLEGSVRTLANTCRERGVDLHPIEFEKDDDTNFHIDFTTATGNLRARNYNIQEAERWRAKIIAGKIIPAVATATAMITGLALMEFFKLATGEKRPLEHYKNAFANLALPSWILSEPIPPKATKDCEYDPIVGGPTRAKPNGFTSWDKWQCDMRGKTLKDFVHEIQTEFDTEVIIVSAGNLCIFNAYDSNSNARLQEDLRTLLKRLTKTADDCNFEKPYVVVQACCTDADGVDVSIPSIKCLI
eukprot:Gregarina_sp_Poly_1__2531@NODE_1687_length_3535_cov_160_559689_g1109_i0_p1_GENE_NODE_1687_length_3535_cov_160_559689_g1109_i0NODE_1687_length_3535_cov_160_559689_g1109_i0_p1_ORF_typecomplete_len1058_score184_99ThiF/PF00899_21/5_1e38ThiF/PF00899_21/4_6e68UBA_e1_thiolCys/PF10585_9/2_6e57UBA_e1_thiolCys/PF10585_9/1_1e04E1_FCCH/PF16190_5/2_7e19E1_4HB/PF16191_5/6_8e18E1_4HB/PF16191_5/6_4e02E1_4HB/PF16191_5/1_7e04E1_UFD/PF09358_10/3_7e13Shikimate_DH/PF01488_20/6_2Shikimate_DH/PF01488_20/13Shikimate_DH